MARHNAGGEFDLWVQNGDRTISVWRVSWRAQEYHFEGEALVLSGSIDFPELTVILRAQVRYEKIGPHILKKTIRLEQGSIPMLYFSLRNTLEPIQPPQHYWTFDHPQSPGGPVFREPFPAAGFRTADGLTMGLLTDSGWKNKWTRMAWKRAPVGGSIPLDAIQPDRGLISLANEADRAEGRHFVALTLGVNWDLRRPRSRLPVGLSQPPEIVNPEAVQGEWKSSPEGGLASLSIQSTHSLPKESQVGVRLRFPVSRRAVYRLLFEYRSNVAITTHAAGYTGFWSQGQPASPDEWRAYSETYSPLDTDLQGDEGSFLIGKAWEAVGPFEIQVRDLRIEEILPEEQPYQIFKLGQSEERTCFIFLDDAPPTRRNLQIASQVCLAEGLSFRGSLVEKILYADFKALTWIAAPEAQDPYVVPSIWYGPDMYFRDLFWTLNGSHDRFLNQALLEAVGATISPEGCIGNILNPYYGCIEWTDNELSYLYILWSYLNWKRFALPPDMEKVSRVTEFIQRHFDPDGDGVILVNNPQGAIDVMWQPYPARFSVSQGTFAVALRAAHALGVPIPEGLIEAAERAYREYAFGGYLHFFPDNHLGQDGAPVGILSAESFTPEFLSIYLFGRKLLPSEIVIQTLEMFPVVNHGCMPTTCKADGSFFTRENNPFSGDLFWTPGTYANGGSWLRMQYMALAVGQLHGWEKAEGLMKARLEAEIDNDPENPVSHEYLSCNQDPTDNGLHRVFAWNLFVLAIHEMLGWRSPEDDPDFEGGVDG